MQDCVAPVFSILFSLCPDTMPKWSDNTSVSTVAMLNVKALACFRVFGGFVGQREVQCYEMIAALAAPCHVHGVGTASVVVSCCNLYGQGNDCGCVF